MNKMITRIIALILTLHLFTGCASTSPQPDMDLDLLDEILQRGTLIIGTEGTYSPNSYHKPLPGRLYGHTSPETSASFLPGFPTL